MQFGRAEKPSPSTKADSPRQAIIIVDDDRYTRGMLCEMVEALGFLAIGAASGLEGLRLVSELRPSVVLLDVEMPQLDGFKVAAAIKSQPGFTPVIMVTARHDAESKRRGQVAGADDFLIKPVLPLELQIRIAAMLRIKTLTDALNDANRRLTDLANTDGLTQLLNRRAIEDALRGAHRTTRRYRRPLSVLLLDIDHFKRVNDTHGHAVGDVVLKAVARVLATSLRKTDRVGRWGGEEFCVVAPETDGDGALLLAERLRQQIERDGGGEAGLVVTVSIGVAAADPDEAAELAAVERADVALYRAKSAGRNRVELAGVG